MILDITSADGAFRENITQRTKGKVSVYVIFTKLKLTIQSIMNSFSDNCSTVIHCRCVIFVLPVGMLSIWRRNHVCSHWGKMPMCIMPTMGILPPHHVFVRACRSWFGCWFFRCCLELVNTLIIESTFISSGTQCFCHVLCTFIALPLTF